MPLAPSARRALERDAAAGAPPIETCSAEVAQATYLATYADGQLPLEPVTESRELHLGAVRVRLWRGLGAPERDAPALLYLHGGGWVIGAPETHEDICRSIANRANAVVISPDYALAPVHPFPAGLEECASILRQIATDPAPFGIAADQIAVGGDSAGGNLAAVLALMARDGTLPPVTAQLLTYPVTDCRQTSTSYRRKANGFGLTAAAMRWFRDHYLGANENVEDWRASPLLARSLAGVAPAFIALAGKDVLFDEGREYAARLDTEARCITQSWPGQIHGFASRRGLIPEGDEAIDALVTAWRTLAPKG